MKPKAIGLGSKALQLACLLLYSFNLFALEVVDDTGNQVALDHPAQRIISLAPHATEMLFAAGAGDQVVGVVSYSDYPQQARTIPTVGGYHMIDLERVLALRPDLVVAWASGNGPQTLQQLSRLGLTLFITEPRSVEMVADSIKRLGLLTGHRDKAEQMALSWLERFQHLKTQYSNKRRLSVFYQIWSHPLMTVNGEHPISRIIELCGGHNIFSELATLAPAVDVEAVLAADPAVIIGGGMGDQRPKWLDDWRQWVSLSAVKHGNLIHINPDLLQRSGPRLVEGAEQLCMALEQARGRE